jgi:hypothetical protein
MSVLRIHGDFTEGVPAQEGLMDLISRSLVSTHTIPQFHLPKNALEFPVVLLLLDKLRALCPTLHVSMPYHPSLWKLVGHLTERKPFKDKFRPIELLLSPALYVLLLKGECEWLEALNSV